MHYEKLYGEVFFDGTQFRALTRGLWRPSPDGVTWASEPTCGTDVFGPQLAYDPIPERYAAVEKQYEEHRFYGSDDGIPWAQSSEANGPPGHELREIVYGPAPAGFVCPGAAPD